MSLRRRRRDLDGSHVLITGAASGIGHATARAMAARGAHLYLTDLNDAGLRSTVEKVERAGGSVVLAQPADVASYDEVLRLGEAVHAHVPAVDVIMNVAGISAWGTVDQLEHRQWRAMVEVNLMGPIHVIETFVPAMIQAGHGGSLVNVSSAAGLLGLPWHAAYSASKFGLRGVSEVLRFDLRRHGIDVTLVCPGAVATPLAGTVEVAGIDSASPSFTRLRGRFLRHAVSPERAAAVMVRAVERGDYLAFTSLDIRVLFFLQRHVEPAYRLVMRVMNDGLTAATRQAEA